MNLKPVRFASGNQPDGNILIGDNKNIVIEVTLLRDSEALRKNEILPILRHSLKVKKKNNLETKLMFFAPKIDYNFKKNLAQNHNSKYIYEGWEEKIKTFDYFSINTFEIDQYFTKNFKISDDFLNENYESLLKNGID